MEKWGLKFDKQTFYSTKTTLKVTKINKYKLLLTKIAI